MMNEWLETWMIRDEWLNTESLPFCTRYEILRKWLKSGV